ncbi:MAG: hypothetical protein ACM3U1_06975 [Chloroflexota bacterium]
MKKYLVALLVILSFAVVKAQDIVDRQGIIDSLTTIDPEIQRYFPRWKVCEPDLQIQIWQSFVYRGDDKSKLSRDNIEILAAPREYDTDPFEILMITCGQSSMNSVEIEATMGDILLGFLSGDMVYQGEMRGERNRVAKRDYCYTDIPIDIPLTSSQAEVIINYLEPTNVTHAFSISLFEQSLKVGETGFWLRNQIGTDRIGYHFWQSGESKIVLQRPLYVNDDSRTRGGIPYLINAYLGGAYRVKSGLANSTPVLSWIGQRKLNSVSDGKFVGGFDFHMPFNPETGVSLNLELPFKRVQPQNIALSEYFVYAPLEDGAVNLYDGSPVNFIAPVLRSSGQFTGFYHWWLDRKNPENYIRFDAGISYAEVREMAIVGDSVSGSWTMTNEATGLRTFKPKEFGDYVYLKVEYRNQAAYPFGMSAQYSNQIFLGRVYIPLFSNWLYLEGKFSTPLRGVRPFEQENFFMISPVLRLTI